MIIIQEQHILLPFRAWTIAHCYVICLWPILYALHWGGWSHCKSLGYINFNYQGNLYRLLLWEFVEYGIRAQSNMLRFDNLSLCIILSAGHTTTEYSAEFAGAPSRRHVWFQCVVSSWAYPSINNTMVRTNFNRPFDSYILTLYIVSNCNADDRNSSWRHDCKSVVKGWDAPEPFLYWFFTNSMMLNSITTLVDWQQHHQITPLKFSMSMAKHNDLWTH